MGLRGLEPPTSSLSVQGSYLVGGHDLATGGSGREPRRVAARRRCCLFCCHRSGQSSLGSEHYDARLRSLAQSLATQLTWAYTSPDVVSDPGRLPRSPVSRCVPFTNPFTFLPLLAGRARAWSVVQVTLDRRQPRLYSADSLYQIVYERAVLVASPA